MKQRRWELIIDNTVVISETSETQFRVQFDVTIDAEGHISYCDLTVSNLKKETINRFFKKNATIGLRAGYEESIDFIFKGRIRNVFRDRDGATVNTRIIARGGDLDRVSINESLGENVTLAKIIQRIADRMGYPLIITKSDFKETYPSGYAMTGSAEHYLSELSESHNFHWTIENDRLVVFSDSSERKSNVLTIDIYNGLEGIPELTEVGVDFSVRLMPKLKIGSRVKIESEFKTFNYSNIYFQDVPPSAGTGSYRIFKINHSGDNYGNTWNSKVTGYKSNYQDSNK
jgi:hypothetical protein